MSQLGHCGPPATGSFYVQWGLAFLVPVLIEERGWGYPSFSPEQETGWPGGAHSLVSGCYRQVCPIGHPVGPSVLGISCGV